MLTLFHHPMFATCRFVRLAFGEFGEEVALIEEKPWTRRKEFLALNAAGTLPVLFGIAFLAALGLVAIGTLFSSMAVNTRLAELLLPMLSLPFFVPVVMTAAQSTSRLLAGRPVSEAWPWLKILVAFDIVFLTACTLAFPYTLDE